MKKVLFLALTITVIFGLASAQDVNPAIHAGAKSLNFTFGGLGAFGLGASGLATLPNPISFTPGLGASYFFNNDAAVRISFQIALPSETDPASPPPGKPGTDATQSAFSLGLGGDYLMYMGTARVRPYVGGGLYLTTTSTDDKNGTGSVDGTGFIQTETKNRAGGITMHESGIKYVGATVFGLQAIMGAEFFVYNDLSVSAEYDLNLFNIASGSDQVVTTGSTSTTTKSPSATTILGIGAAGATIHIYF